ncbi:hypothetical protein JTB14_018761 [Gonioctena quinquepunctata]|nr:hypothetical protein JTB14_018761 [Gonioctena quinquepunctata]
MEKDDRNILPDEGIKDKPPEKTAADSQKIQVPTEVSREQERKSEQGHGIVKLQLENPLEKNYVSGFEQEKGEVSPDTPEQYMDCSFSTPIRQGKDTVQENWSKSDDIEQVELLENNAILDTNIENDSVRDSIGEIKHTSEVRETGSLGSNASLAQEISDYGQFVVPNNSHSPINASSADESIQDNELIDNSLNQTIRPNIYSGRKILTKNREIFRSESKSEAEELGNKGQFKMPNRPFRRSSRIVARMQGTHSDSEIMPSPKRKRKASPDGKNKNMNEIKEFFIQES